MAQLPILRGWGGVRLYEVNRFTEANTPHQPRSTPPSEVFPTEVASNTEMVIRLLKQRGYNAIRVFFESEHTVSNPGDPQWAWNDTWFEKVIQLAKHYDLYLILDYHGYCEPYQFTNDWLNKWRDIISRYGQLYNKFAWEPCNEPRLVWQDDSHRLEGQAAVDELQLLYQMWIDMCRGLADTNLIIASAVQWWNSLPDPVDWYPVLHDPLNKLYQNWHFYYMYAYNTPWTVEGALANADYWTNIALRVRNKLGVPYMTSESGADFGSTAPPDVILPGSAGYSTVSLAFIKRIVENFEKEGMGYILWPAGDWTSKSELYGAMDTWGELIPLPAPTPPSLPPIMYFMPFLVGGTLILWKEV